jgi:hypothetical protein
MHNTDVYNINKNKDGEWYLAMMMLDGTTASLTIGTLCQTGLSSKAKAVPLHNMKALGGEEV